MCRPPSFPGIVVPLSLIGTFGVMLLAGFSLNNLTLMALTIATGFVVDDAIVMLENIARYIEKGEKPLDAALKGAKQIGFTLVSLTISLIAVLIPLLFMADLVGKLFHEFAVTLAVAIALSLVVSLTLTPMMCARFLKQGHAASHEGKADYFTKLVGHYERGLDWVLERQPATLMSVVATLLLTVGALSSGAEGLLPGAGRRAHPGHQRSAAVGVVQRHGAAPAGVGGSRSSKIRTWPRLSSFIGVDGTNATLNTGRLLIELKPHGERERSALEVIERLQESVAQRVGHHPVPAARAGADHRRPRQPHAVPVHAHQSGLRPSCNEWTGRFLEKLRESPALADVASDLQSEGLQAFLRDRPRRRRAAGHLRGVHRRRAVRRLRPAPDLHHLHAGQPVPRGAGSPRPSSSSGPRPSNASA